MIMRINDNDKANDDDIRIIMMLMTNNDIAIIKVTY